MCEPRSLVVLLDASLAAQSTREDNSDIWTALPIFTYQQIAQRLTHTHTSKTEFRAIVGVYGKRMKILFDKKVKDVKGTD